MPIRPRPDRPVERRLAAALRRLLVVLGLVAAAAPPLLAQICGNPGKDGPGGTLTGVVNSYWPGAASAGAGATTLSLGSGTGGTPIAVGDLLLVMQVQEATLDLRNNARYGSGGSTGSGATSLADAGRYEYVVATSAVGLAGGTVGIRGAGGGGGLLNAYENNAPTATNGHERFQVVRVPQYSTATFASGLTALAWNGSVGGVLAVDVAGVLTMSGTVSVDGKGFRGGGARMLTGGAGGSSNDYVNLATLGFHASKGEGVAGTPRYVAATGLLVNTGVEGYPDGSTARGAPANAGGGGTDGNPTANDENSGGGGGANWGAGGQGGRSWNSGLDIGGRGGTSLSGVTSAARVFLGGGGGAGTTNNGTPDGTGILSSGAAGGGIVIVRAGSLAGTGTINANGLSGSGNVTNDGSGGGGGGGSIVVYVGSGGLTGLSLSARGGNGGNNTGGGVSHGPGGGGGGGYILTSGAVASATVTGGNAGYTVTVGTNFGATAGTAGLAATTLTAGAFPGVSPPSSCVPALTVAKTTTTPTVTAGSGAAVTYVVTVANAAGRATADNVWLLDTLPTGMVFQSIVAGTLTGGATYTPTFGPTPGDTVGQGGYFTIPGGGSVQAIFTVVVPSTAAGGKRDNTVRALYPDPARTTSAGQASAVYLGTSGTAEDVTITAVSDLRVSKRKTAAFVAGASRAYKIAVRNDGGLATSAAVTLKDTIPAGLTFVSATASVWSCAQASGVLTCTRPSIASRATADTITVTVTVGAAAPSPTINRAWASGGGEPPGLAADNVGADTAAIGTVGVNVTPDLAPASRLPSNGTLYSQLFTVANGGSTADTYTLLASGSPGSWVKVDSVSGVAGAGGSVALAGGGTTTVRVAYHVVDTSSAGVQDTLILRATSTTAGTVTDRGTLVVTVLRAALAMTKQLYLDDRTTLVGTSPVSPGTYVQYKVTVTSAGGADATSVAVTDTIPSQVIYDSASGDAAGWTFVAATGTVTATLASPLAVGASRYFWVRVRVK